MRERRKKSFKVPAGPREEAAQELVSLWGAQPGTGAGLLGQERGRRSAPLPSRIPGVLPAVLPSAFPAQPLASLPSAPASHGKTFKPFSVPSAAPAQRLRRATGTPSAGVPPVPPASGHRSVNNKQRRCQNARTETSTAAGRGDWLVLASRSPSEALGGDG